MTNTYLPFRNGVTVAVSGWAEALRRSGHEVAVWTVGGRSSADDVYAVRAFGEIAHGFPLPLSSRAPAAVRAHRWDVVHAHHPVVLGPAAARFARSHGAVLAATAHSDYLAYLDAYAAPAAVTLRPLLRNRFSRFFDACDVVFAPSASIAHALGEWGVGTVTVPCTYPIDVARFAPLGRAEARRRLGMAADTPIALYVGRLAAEKRVLELIDEFARTLRTVPDARLVIVGAGPLESRIRARARRLGDSVVVAGLLEQAQLGAWYCAADTFVSASGNEVGPLVAIEAGLCGTPSVAYRVPGFRDRVLHDSTGILVEPREGALGFALADLLAHRERAHRMGAKAARVLAHHTPVKSAALLVDGYLEGGRGWMPESFFAPARNAFEVGTEQP